MILIQVKDSCTVDSGVGRGENSGILFILYPDNLGLFMTEQGKWHIFCIASYFYPANEKKRGEMSL